MFRWTMTLETGVAEIDHPRRRLIEAMDDFFRIVDDPGLTQHMVAERTGAVFNAMKASFSAEDAFLASRTEEARARHHEIHTTLMGGYVDLCKKLVPRIKSLKQGQQACLEIYGFVDHSLYKHLVDETLAYKQLLKAQAHPA